MRHPAFTLVETLVSIGILSLLAALTLAGVQKVRASAARATCQNNLRQLSLSLQQYATAHGTLPPGISGKESRDGTPFMGWHVRILPHVEQQAMHDQAFSAYKAEKDFLRNPPHVGLTQAVKVFGCPTDARTLEPQTVRGTVRGLTAYLGNEGLSSFRMEGVLFLDSAVKMTDITDGASNTLMIGERPPSADLSFGWWYAGWGQDQDGEAEMLLGVRTKNRQPYRYDCAIGPHAFGPGTVADQCSMFHFWSLHTGGGANFAFADGSVRFLRYSANDLLPALATRAGGEPAPSLE